MVKIFTLVKFHLILLQESEQKNMLEFLNIFAGCRYPLQPVTGLHHIVYSDII